MLNFIMMFCAILIFVRIYINKFDIQGKDIISIGVALSLTAILNLIQWLIDAVLKIII